MEITLREVCKEMNVSRRAVQGYERAGLVTASGRTERGYLLYDEETQKRIKKIRMLQDFGFSIKEIKKYIDAPPEILKPVLKDKLNILEAERKKLLEMIRELSEWIAKM